MGQVILRSILMRGSEPFALAVRVDAGLSAAMAHPLVIRALRGSSSGMRMGMAFECSIEGSTLALLLNI